MQKSQYLIVLCVMFLIQGILTISFCVADSPEMNSAKTLKEVLSSDLLQILDRAYCPPGQSPDDIILEMEKNGQIRRNETGAWIVHVTIEFDTNTTSRDVLSLLTDSTEDTTYHLITGWVSSENLTTLAKIKGINRIIPVFPPINSGSLEIITEEPMTDSIPDNAWKTKLSTDLLQLADDNYLSPGQSRADAMSMMEKTGEIRIANEEIEVRISGKTNISSSPTDFESYFSEPVLDSAYGRIGGWIPVANITRLAMEEGITSLITQIPPRTSEIQTEGDYLLETKEFRNSSGLNGSGIKVGVISDGVDGLANLQTIGELPEIDVLSNMVGGDEGLAMLQIIHDIAPNATLMFHDRGDSQIEYVHALDQLIIQGCDIICDDITYVEPFFEDGYISQNIIDRILSYNILYITAAGNFAEEHYQAPFVGYENQGYFWQDFNLSLIHI